jgi:energy-converting hydrogenase Eha subunit A
LVLAPLVAAALRRWRGWRRSGAGGVRRHRSVAADPRQPGLRTTAPRCAAARSRSLASDAEPVLRSRRMMDNTATRSVHMKRTMIFLLVLAGVVAGGIGVMSATAGNSTIKSSQPTTHMHSSHSTAAAQATPLTAADLRVTLDRLLGEHAALAMNATNLGVTGSPSFNATAKSLDQNSVALSKAIGSIYGAKAANTFLNGPFQWRAHIKFFVDYTVAVAKKDTAAQAKAVANLKTYTVRHGAFLASATGLPTAAVQRDLLAHVLELKAQLDAYANGNYAKAAALYRDAYAHMFMTGDLLAGAIAKQKNLR